MDGSGVAYSHLLHSAARHLHGLHRERPSHHVSWSGLVAGAAERGGGPRSGAHDRGCLSRITTEKYSAAADWRPGGLCQCGERGERGRPQSAVAHGRDRAFGQPEFCPGGRHAGAGHVAYTQSPRTALDNPDSPDSQYRVVQYFSRCSESAARLSAGRRQGGARRRCPGAGQGAGVTSGDRVWARSWP